MCYGRALKQIRQKLHASNTFHGFGPECFFAYFVIDAPYHPVIPSSQLLLRILLCVLYLIVLSPAALHCRESYCSDDGCRQAGQSHGDQPA
jgi:hypothetical protein